MNINELNDCLEWLGWKISRGCKRLQMLSMNINDNKQYIWIHVIVNEYKCFQWILLIINNTYEYKLL